MSGLEIGGEEHPAYPEYDQLDNVTTFGATIIDDAKYLASITNESYDHVYACNVLEHFSWRDTDLVLKNWFRVVKSYGLLEIVVPDTLGIIQHYLDGIDKWEHTCKRLAGTQDYPGNTHLAFFTWDDFERIIPTCTNYEIEQTHKGAGITARIWK